MGRFDPVWELLDGQVADGWLPGYVAALRCGGEVEVRAGGSRTIDEASMTVETPFRLASVTKPFAGALVLSLVEDGVLSLDDAVGRWLPELASPRVVARRGGP